MRTFGVLLLLTVLAWWLGSVSLVGSRVDLSFTGIIILAAMALVGPAGAGIVGMVMGPFQAVTVRLRTRVFNSAMFAILGVAGGAAYRGRRWRSRRDDAHGFVEDPPPHRLPAPDGGPRAVRREPGARRHRGPPRLGTARCASRCGGSSPQRGRRTSATGSSPSSWSCCGGRAGCARPASSSSFPRSSWRSGPTGSTPKSSRATSGPSTCWSRPSRPRLPTSSGTAPGWPS